MPQIDFVEAFARKRRGITGNPTLAIFSQDDSTTAVPVYVDPDNFRRSRLGRSEWLNLSFAAITLLGGLFSAFYLFNGAELFRNALAWPREFLYARTLELAGQGAMANDADATGRPWGVRAPKTDPTGDPFPRVGGPLTLERSPYVWVRQAGGLPGTTSLRPTIPGSPGAPGGGLPGAGTLVSRLTLLVPGTDALTQSLRAAAADLEKNITVTIRHDVSRVGNVRSLVRRVRVVTRVLSVAGRGRGHGQTVLPKQNVCGGHAITAISSGISSTGGTSVNGSSGSAVSVGRGATSSGIGSMVGAGVGGGLGVLGGVTGAVGSVVGSVGGLTGGGHSGVSGGGGHR